MQTSCKLSPLVDGFMITPMQLSASYSLWIRLSRQLRSQYRACRQAPGTKQESAAARYPLQNAARSTPDNGFLSKAVAAAEQETRKCRQIKAVCRDNKSKLKPIMICTYFIPAHRTLNAKQWRWLAASFSVLHCSWKLFELCACRHRGNCSALNIYWVHN